MAKKNVATSSSFHRGASMLGPRFFATSTLMTHNYTCRSHQVTPQTVTLSDVDEGTPSSEASWKPPSSLCDETPTEDLEHSGASGL